MTLTIKKKLTPYNFSDANNIGRIKYIVIHYFGSLGTAEAVANYFVNAYRGASAHYSLDEGPVVWQSVEDEDIAWHCGTSGTYYHAYCRNSNSIGIEVRPYKIDKSRTAYAGDTDWYFTDEIIANLVIFVKYLMKKYNIPVENVVRHYDVTRKYCPRPYMGDDINTYHKVSGNTMWKRFKDQLVAEESEDEDVDFSKLTDKEIDILIDRMNKRLAAQPLSEYAKTASAKGVKSGLFSDGDKDGLVDNPQGFLRRQELAAVLDRAGMLDKKY